MRNYIYILLVCLITVSCDELEIKPVPGPLVTAKDSSSELENKPFSNPALIYGSDFGNFFQTLYIQGEYETMLAFTSQMSIDLHGEDVILEHYKKMQFGYKLGKPKKMYDEDGIKTLVYIAEINATEVRTHLDIVIENDSCKIIVYQDLEDFPMKY